MAQMLRSHVLGIRALGGGATSASAPWGLVTPLPTTPTDAAAPFLPGPGSGQPQLKRDTRDSHPDTVTHSVTPLSFVSLGMQ